MRETIKRGHWTLRRPSSAFPVSARRSSRTISTTAATNKPGSLRTSLAKFALGISVPAVVGAALAIYTLIGQALEPKSVVTLTVRTPPQALADAGLNRDAFEARLAAELKMQFENLSLPMPTAAPVYLPAQLQSINADAKIEIASAEVPLRATGMKLRSLLGREDVGLDVSLLRNDAGYVVTIISEIGGHKTSSFFVFPKDRDLGFLPGAVGEFAADAVSPLVKVARRTRDYLTCMPNCDSLLVELIEQSRLAATSGPTWDDADANLLWAQFEVMRSEKQGRPLAERRRMTAHHLDAAIRLGRDNDSVLMHAALMQRALDMKTSKKTADRAIAAFARGHSLRQDPAANLCHCAQNDLSAEARSTLVILCITRTFANLDVLTLDQAWRETEWLRFIGQHIGNVEMFSASLWAPIDPIRARSIFESAANGDPSGGSDIAYAVFMADHGNLPDALDRFGSALRKMGLGAEPAIENYALDRVRDLATRLGQAAVARDAVQCANVNAPDRGVCKEELAARIESVRTAQAPTAMPRHAQRPARHPRRAEAHPSQRSTQ